MTRQELRAQGQATLKGFFGSDEQTRGVANLLTALNALGAISAVF